MSFQSPRGPSERVVAATIVYCSSMGARAIATLAVMIGCAHTPVVKPPSRRLAPEPAIATEVVRWDRGRETVLAHTVDLDPTAWPGADAGIWFVRPAQPGLGAEQLRAFVARAVALQAAGISVAGQAAAGDASISALAQRPPALAFVDLSGTAVTDAGVRAVADLPGLQHAWLSSTAITDASLIDLARRRSLASVRIDNTKITDAGLIALAELPHLLVVSAAATAITDAGLATLLAKTSLTYLAASNTRITGAALQALAAACSLTGIDLAGTRIDDAGATALFRACRQLDDVNLARTSLADSSALAGLPLRRLDLSHTAVRTRTLDVIAAATGLTSLELGDTNIIARDLAALRNLRALEHLGLAHLGVRAEAIDVIVANPALRELDVAGADIGDDDALRLGVLAHLVSMDLSSTRVTDAVGALLAGRKLERLALARTTVTDATVARLSTTALRVLDLTGTNVTTASVQRIAASRELEELYLSGSAIASGLDQLGKLRKLRILHVASLPFDDVAGASLRQSSLLEELELSNTKVTGATLAQLRSLVHLRSLGLDHLSVTDEDAVRIANLPALETLTLRGSSLTDAGAAALGHAPQLGQLSIEDTTVSDEGCRGLALSRSLEVINLSRTHVTAVCVAAASAAPHLRELYADALALTATELRFAPGSHLEVLSLEDAALDDRALPELLGLRSLRKAYLREARFSPRGAERLRAAGITH